MTSADLGGLEVICSQTIVASFKQTLKNLTQPFVREIFRPSSDVAEADYRM